MRCNGTSINSNWCLMQIWRKENEKKSCHCEDPQMDYNNVHISIVSGSLGWNILASGCIRIVYEMFYSQPGTDVASKSSFLQKCERRIVEAIVLMCVIYRNAAASTLIIQLLGSLLEIITILVAACRHNNHCVHLYKKLLSEKWLNLTLFRNPIHTRLKTAVVATQLSE